MTDFSFIMELQFYFDCLSLTYTDPILLFLDKTAHRNHSKGIMMALQMVIREWVQSLISLD